MNGVENISFNIYADSPQDAENLKIAIANFINYFGQQGIKVKANVIADAINGWGNNAIVRNQIIKTIKNGN